MQADRLRTLLIEDQPTYPSIIFRQFSLYLQLLMKYIKIRSIHKAITFHHLNLKVGLYTYQLSFGTRKECLQSLYVRNLQMICHLCEGLMVISTRQTWPAGHNMDASWRIYQINIYLILSCKLLPYIALLVKISQPTN